MLVDSGYDTYSAALCLVRIVDGEMKKGQQDPADGTDAAYTVERIGQSPQAGGRWTRSDGEDPASSPPRQGSADTRVVTHHEDKRDGKQPAGSNRHSLSCSMRLFCSMRRIFEELRAGGAMGKPRLNDAQFFVRNGNSAASASASAALSWVGIWKSSRSGWNRIQSRLIATAPSGLPTQHDNGDVIERA